VGGMNDADLDPAARARLNALRRSLDLRLDAEGTWYHEGVPFTHPRLVELFDRGLDVHPDTGEPTLRVDDKWCFVRVDDVPFLVRALTATDHGLEARLNTRETLSLPADLAFEMVGDRVYLQLDPRRRARLTRPAQAALASWLVEREGALEVRAGGRRWPVVARGEAVSSG
jgi:hypothetical protein